jgi:hypothetical protein
VFENSVEENIWTEERRSDGRLEKTGTGHVARLRGEEECI